MSGAFLERMKLVAFGAFSNRMVGPFGPGLNVVFGRNESGKTTLASFVGGVLFGWPDARGNRNTYKPLNTERAGSLFFSWEDDVDREVVLTRVRNADGLQGDDSIIEDIDKDTFNTMFSLTSDELRSLRNTSDITAKLLTAGSGTAASPAHALEVVQARLDEYVSRAAAAEQSLLNLRTRENELRAKISAAADEADRFKRDDKEQHDLEPERAELRRRLEVVQGEIEALTGYRANLEKLVEERQGLRRQIAEAREEEESLEAEHDRRALNYTPLIDLTEAQDRALRDQLDALSVEETKLDHAIDLARENFTSSKAEYDAQWQTENAQAEAARYRRQRTVQIVLSVTLPLLFMAAGIPLLVHGRDIKSLSFTAVGVGLVVFAVFLALAALVMLFRSGRDENAKEEARQAAEWVMVKDQKKLEACQANRDAFDERVLETLAKAGLGEAQGSLRRARALLDDAQASRTERAQYLQRHQAFVSRRASLEESLGDSEESRARLCATMGLRPDDSVEAVDALLGQKTEQRVSLQEASERLDRRYGELQAELAQATLRTELDELKLQREQVRTRIEESSHDYARLLLAKRMLEASIAAWESTSQPEVYRQASRLFELMTEGRWTRVSLGLDGRLRATDSLRTTLDPMLLSLGTCQQLYLSLRIALLMTAGNVGRAIPILADDILVNFDDRRRVGAARALAELARVRQVILFTCHEDVVATLLGADEQARLLEL